MLHKLFLLLFGTMGLVITPLKADPCDNDECEVENDIVTFNLYAGCNVEVEVEILHCDGYKKFKYVDIIYLDPVCDYLAGEVDRLIDLKMLGNVEGFEIPDCGSGSTQTIEKLNTASCNFVRICEAEAQLLKDLECNDGTTEDGEDQVVTYETREILNCGQACCKDVLNVCKSGEKESVIVDNFQVGIIETECDDPPNTDKDVEPEDCNVFCP